MGTHGNDRCFGDDGRFHLQMKVNTDLRIQRLYQNKTYMTQSRVLRLDLVDEEDISSKPLCPYESRYIYISW